MLIGSCTFELGMCSWTNQANGNNKTTQDNFDWTLGSGGTASWYTGPSTDHTTSSAFGTSMAYKCLNICNEVAVYIAVQISFSFSQGFNFLDSLVYFRFSPVVILTGSLGRTV